MATRDFRTEAVSYTMQQSITRTLYQGTWPYLTHSQSTSMAARDWYEFALNKDCTTTITTTTTTTTTTQLKLFLYSAVEHYKDLLKVSVELLFSSNHQHRLWIMKWVSFGCNQWKVYSFDQQVFVTWLCHIISLVVTFTAYFFLSWQLDFSWEHILVLLNMVSVWILGTAEYV